MFEDGKPFVYQISMVNPDRHYVPTVVHTGAGTTAYGTAEEAFNWIYNGAK